MAGRFEIDDGEIIDTKERQIIPMERFQQLASPQERTDIEGQLRADGFLSDEPPPVDEARAQPAPSAPATPQSAPSARPSLEEFLPAARQDNPGVSDRDLRRYWAQNYSDIDPRTLPTWETFLPTAKSDNPGVSQKSLRTYWEENYGDFGAQEKEPSGSDAGRGFSTAFKQLPQLAAGVAAGAGTAIESMAGEGGIGTGLKKFGVQKFQEASKEIADQSKASDSFSHAYDQAKQGNFGALVDWLQYGLGYAGGQAVQMLATGGLGYVGGKIALQTVAKGAAEKLVAKEAARISATEAGATLGAQELQRLATANVAAKVGQLGQTAAVGTAAVGMEGGEIFGDLASKSVEEGRSLTGEELGRAFGATLAAGALEFVGDKVGLDLLVGKSPIGKVAGSLPGVGGRVARAGIAGTTGAAIEGGTEFAQTLIEEAGKGGDPFGEASIRDAIDATALGAVGGGAVGGATGLIRTPQQPLLTAPSEPPRLEQPGVLKTDPLLSAPDTIGVGNPGVSIDEAIKRTWDLLDEDAAAQEQNALTAQRQAEQELANLGPVAENTIPIPRTGQEIPILEPGQPTTPAPLPITQPSALWMQEAMVPGIEPGQAFQPRTGPTPDPRDAIARERERLAAMRTPRQSQEEPAPTQEMQDAPLRTAADLAFPPEERGRIPSQQDLLLRQQRTAPRQAFDVPILPGGQAQPSSPITSGAAFTPRAEPELSPRERIAQERERLLAMQGGRILPAASTPEASSTQPQSASTIPDGMPSQPERPEEASSAVPPEADTTPSPGTEAAPSIDEVMQKAKRSTKREFLATLTPAEREAIGETGLSAEDFWRDHVTGKPLDASQRAESEPSSAETQEEPAETPTPGGFDGDAFDRRQQEIKESVEQSKAEGNTHLDQLPFGVEAVRGVRIRSIRDGSTGVVTSANSDGTMNVQWDNEESSQNNSGSPETHNGQTEYHSSLVKSDFPEFVVQPGGKALVKQGHVVQPKSKQKRDQVEKEKAKLGKKSAKLPPMASDRGPGSSSTAQIPPEPGRDLTYVDQEGFEHTVTLIRNAEITLGQLISGHAQEVRRLANDDEATAPLLPHRIPGKILVKEVGDGEFALVDGFSRTAGLVAAGQNRIPVTIVRPQSSPNLSGPQPGGPSSASEDPFSLQSQTVTQAKPKAPQPEQTSIDVPAPTVGERPIIGRDVNPETAEAEAPLFSKAAQEPELEQTSLPESSQPQGLTGSARIAEQVKDVLSRGGVLTSEELFQLADSSFGGTRGKGTYTDKDAYDALELGINRYILEQDFSQDGVFNGDTTLFKARQGLKDIRDKILEKIPTQRPARTQEQNEFQQFSTPPDLAYVMNWAANITDKDVMLEPSAGIGGLAVFAKKAGAKVYVNEYSNRRLEVLKQLPFDGVFNENAEQINNILPKEIKPTVIIMNPPFSSTAGRKEGERSSRNVLRHLDQALARLQPGGRLVALIGQGRDGKDPQFLEEWKKLTAMKYAYRGRIGLSGQGYKKYGTTYDNQLLIFDKIKPDGRAPINANVADVFEALPLLAEVRNARTHAASESQADQSASAQPRSEAVAPTRESGSRPESTVSAGSDAVGARGERPGANTRESSGTQGATPADRDRTPEQSGQDLRTDVPAPRAGESERSAAPESENTAEQPGPEGRGDAEPGRAGQSGERGPDTGSQLPGRVTVEAADEEAPVARTESDNSIFEAYRPKKVKVSGAKEHPGKLVESAAMAAVEPPAATYHPSLPASVIKSGKLSLAQLEPVIYAGQSHEQLLPDGSRRGFFDGDGTGVGKGREIAGIILDNMNKGRKKAVWVSKNAPLFESAVRDWKDVAGGKGDELFAQGKLKLADGISRKDGILFTTYNLLGDGLDLSATGNLEAKKDKAGNAKGPQTRFDQLVNWLGQDFDGVIVFDEAHEMRNNMQRKGSRGAQKPAMKALAGVELQKRFPKARIAYFSATGGIEVSDFGYAERLGMWGAGTPFSDKRNFAGAIESGGLAAMEIVAQDLKANGLYLSRSLSYDDVTYERVIHALTPAQREIYDDMARGWQTVLQNLNQALEVTGANQNGNAKSAARSAFWGAQQRFFNQILTALQLPTVIERIKKDVDDGQAVVIQLVNTNEAAQNRQIKEKAQEGADLDDLDLTPRENLLQYLDKAFPTQEFETYTDENGNTRSSPVTDSEGRPVQNAEAVAMKEELMQRLGSLKVPEGPLEMIINTFGPDAVAEVTGRGKRVVRLKDADGNQQTVIQKRTRNVAMKEASDFMDDKRSILVFSDAGGTGQSFHADLSKKNTRRRMHYVVQPGWRADAAMQGLGRTHRTNQKSAPHYLLVSTDLNGHKRFISTIARRLAQLGALTKGQRQTSSQGLFSEKDNLENAYAAGSLRQFFVDLKNGRIEGFGWDELLRKLGLEGMLDKNGNLMEDKIPDVPQFLNRILSLEYEDQNKVFDQFFERMERAIEVAEANGTLDTGLENYRADSVTLKKEQVVYEDPNTKAKTRLLTFEAKHKINFLPYGSVQKKAKFNGFYIGEKTGKIYATYAGGFQHTKKDGEVETQIKLQEPDATKVRMVSEKTFKDNYRKVVTSDAAKEAWQESIDKAPHFREETLHLLSGSLLKIWDRLGGSTRVFRVTTDQGKRVVGRVVPEENLSRTMERLGVTAEKQSFSNDKVLDALEDGATIELANGWKIARRTVADEDRFELLGDNLYGFRNELTGYGVFVESRNFKTRFFIPTDKAREVIEKITQHRPILRIQKRGKEGGLVASMKASQKSTFSDPSPEEANTVQRAIEGKTVLEAAQFIANESPSPAYRLIAERVVKQLRQLQSAGMDFTLHVAHENDTVPDALINTRGMAWLPEGSMTTQVWVQGADVTGFVGTSYENVLHELLHAATQAAIHIGLQESMADTEIGKSTKALAAVYNRIVQHFNDRVRATERKEGTLTPFEQAIWERRSNALRDPGEVISWAFTSPEMQHYLEGIPYQGQSLWTRFVQAIRKFLGLLDNSNTALSEVLRVGEEILSSPADPIVRSLRAIWMPSQINQYKGLLNANQSTQARESGADQVSGNGRVLGRSRPSAESERPQTGISDEGLTFDDLNSPDFDGLPVAEQQAATETGTISPTTARDRLAAAKTSARPYLLGALGLQQLSEVYGRDHREVSTYNKASQQMEADFLERTRVSDAVIKRWDKLPIETADRMARIMEDARFANWDPDQQKNSAPPSNDKERLLRDRFEGLPVEAKAVYREARDFYSQLANDRFDAIAERIRRAGGTPENTKAALDKLHLAYERVRAKVYFPFTRFGDHIVVAKKMQDGKEIDREVSAFESPAEANRFATMMKARGWTVKQTLSKEYAPDRDGSASKAVKDILKIVDGLDETSTLAGGKADLKDAINQTFIHSLPDMSYAKHFLHAKDVKGFSKDALRAFAHSALHGAHHISRINNADRLTKALDDLDARIRDTAEGDVTEARQVYNELVQRHTNILNPNTSPVAAWLGQLGFTMSLGGVVATGFTNLTQVPLVTLPWLGARYGAAQSTAALARAYKDFLDPKTLNSDSLFDASQSLRLPESERAMLKELQRRGRIDLTQTMDLAGRASQDNLSRVARQTGTVRDKIAKLLGFTFHAPEVMNRQVTALATYRLAKERGASTQEAIDKAEQAIIDTHFIYTAENRPRYMSGNVMRVLTMFKQYSQNIAFLYGRAAQVWLSGQGATPEERQIAKRQLLAMTGLQFAAAGALGMPFVGTVASLLTAILNGFGDDDEKKDWDVELRKMLADSVGTEAGEVLAHGVSRLTPWDLAGRLGQSDLFFRAPSREREGRAAAMDWATSFAGPVLGYAVNAYLGASDLATGLKDADAGHFMRGVEELAPAVLRNGVRALRFELEGGARTRDQYKQLDLDYAEKLGQFFGFAPARVAEMYESGSAIKNAEHRIMARRNDLLDQYAASIQDQDADARQDVLEEIREFNRRHRFVAITGATLSRSIKGRQEHARGTQDGVYLPKKRQPLREEGAFANL